MSRRQQKNVKLNRPAEIAQGRARQRALIPPVIVLTGLTVGVVLAVLIVHQPALHAKALLFDDAQYMTKNTLVQNPSWASAGRFLTEVFAPSTVKGYYQPLSMISLMLDYAGGGRPDHLLPFHRTSLVLHAFNTALVVILLYRLFGEPWVAAMVGLLFGLHPMTVETMPWVGERKTLLASFFALWCLILYVRYTRTGGKSAYAACLALYVLALMSKPTSTPLPILFLIMDYWPIRRLSRRALVEKVPFFVMGAVFAVITVVSQGRTAVAQMPTETPFSYTVLTLCHNIVFYLYKMVWPTNLSPHYPYPNPFNLSDKMVLAGVVGTCLLLPALFISLRWTRALLAGCFFFFVAIFPSMGVIGFTNVIASDKFAYLPSVGLLMVLAWFLGWFWKSSACAVWVTKRRFTALAAFLVLAASETMATRHTLTHWQETEGLFRYMLAMAPHTDSTHYSLATVLAELNKTDEAIDHYKTAIRLNPIYLDAHYNLANALIKQGHLDEAITHYQTVLRIDPNFVLAHSNLGNALLAKGHVDEAIGHLRRTLELQPDNFRAHNNLANALAQEGRHEEAIRHYQRAVEVTPGFALGYRNLGQELAQVGRLQEAVQAYRAALQIEPLDAQTRYGLGMLLVTTGDVRQAVREFNRVLQLDPAHEGARKTLADLSAGATTQ